MTNREMKPSGPASARIERHKVCADPVFVVGAPRSGTNILARSLDRHPDLWTSGESHFLFLLYGAGRADAAFDSAIEASPLNWLKKNEVDRGEFLRSLGIGASALFTSKSRGKRWIEHTPHYVLMAETLSEMFPEAKFLHIIRDGRRVVHSMSNYAKRFNERKGSSSRTLPRWAADFRTACATWTRYVEAGARFAETLPQTCVGIKNEDLVQSPRQTFERIYEFIGVPSHPAPIRYARSHRLNSSFGSEPQGKPVLDEPWLEWDDERRSIFAEESGDMMIRCGFATREELGSGQTADASESPDPAPTGPAVS